MVGFFQAVTGRGGGLAVDEDGAELGLWEGVLVDACAEF